ncbi:MAG: alpha,alpha-trehalose-phosphate synthase (UDP-forming), partial [Rhodothermales bacterium]
QDVAERQMYPADEPDFAVRRVPLSEQEVKRFYYGMANRVLWPVAHYMLHHLDLDIGFMEVYREINRRFAGAVVEEYRRGDQVWVQDYHLMMCPKYIREKLPEVPLAFFWHIPWPAMEVFRILPWARELLRGMLGCDLIGFHVEEYVENFLESARVLLGARTEGNTVLWEGRRVRVEAHPIGIDTESFTRMGFEGESDAMRVRDDVVSEHLLLGVDRLDYTKGILSRLHAYEVFLKSHPEYHRRVAFLQIATPSRTKVESYRQLKREVDEMVGRINGAFAQDGWTPVHYRYRTYTHEELCVFYRAANVAFITPWRDGMNLVALEYVAANEDGVLILSELTGAAYLLSEALQVNPYDIDGTVACLKEALEMPADERRQRMQFLKETVRRLDVHSWAESFLQSLAVPTS